MRVIYMGPDSAGVYLPEDGTHLAPGEPVAVPAALAEQLLKQSTFTKEESTSDGRSA